MVLPDVNVLVYAHREDTAHHAGCRNWLEKVINGHESYGLAELVLSGFVRVATHAKVFIRPSTLSDALAFTEQLRGRANCVPVAPGLRHWDIFRALCSEARARGNLVPTLTWPHWRSSRAASGSPRIGISAGSRVCAGDIRFSSTVRAARTRPRSTRAKAFAFDNSKPYAEATAHKS